MASQTARKFQLCFHRYFFFLFFFFFALTCLFLPRLSRPFFATSPLRVSLATLQGGLQLSPGATLSTLARATFCYRFALLCQARAEKVTARKQKAVEKENDTFASPKFLRLVSRTSPLKFIFTLRKRGHAAKNRSPPPRATRNKSDVRSSRSSRSF